MTVTSISYKKIFPGSEPYTNTTLGVEIAVNEGEKASDAFDLAKKTIEDWINPPKQINGKLDFIPHESIANIPIIDRKQVEKIEIAIDNAKTKEELNKLKPTLPTSLMEHFEKRLNELS